MFVLFVAALATTVGGTIVTVARGAGKQSLTVNCLWAFAVAGGVFAAIYLPVRWKTLRGLEPPFKVLGLIGGFGLIAMALLAGLAIAVAVAAS